jgi:small basic protein
VIAILALLVGIGVGLYFQPELPVGLTPYLPVIVVAALDTVLAGMLARLEGGYQEGEFILAFVSNTALAAFIVWVGDRLGAPDLTIGVVVVFGIRMFQSLAGIRRYLFRE